MNIWLPRSVIIRNIIDRVSGRTVRHRHDYVQAGYVLNGVLTVELGPQKAFIVGAGEFFCIALRQEHVIANTCGQDVHSIDLRFKVNPADREVKDRDIPGGKSLNGLVNFSFTIPRSSAGPIRGLMERMRDLDEKAILTREFTHRLHLLHLARIAEKLPKKNRHRFFDTAGEHLALVRAVDVIQARYHRPMDIETLADAAGVSKWYLCRLFARHIGQSPKQFLIRHRIDVAKRLMTEYDTTPLKEIAHRTGFADVQDFSRTFRKVEGCSPTQFLKS
jgi:AraC-like DNA-binding protein